MLKSMLTFVAAAGLSIAASAADAAETVRVGGTGVGLAWAGKAGRLFEAQDPGNARIEVLPSLGTPGGLRALVAGDIEVALAARPLNDGERAQGLREAACLKSAFVFATSRPAAPGIALADLPGIYARPDPRWPDGQPLKIILRSPSGSENAYLASLQPGMEEAIATASRRLGIPVGNTDQENVELLVRTAGSFGMTTLLQVRAEDVPLTPIAVNGIRPTATTIADGSYPMPMSLCVVLPAAPAAAADRFVLFLRSPPARELAAAYGAALKE